MKQTDFDQELMNTLHSLKTNGEFNPSLFFKENTKVRLMNLISDEGKVMEKKPGFVFVKNPKFTFRLAGIFIIILALISTGTILAAQSATPKSQLYPVKLASEEVALKLSPNASFKADIAVEIAKRRGNEITSEQKSVNKSEIKQGIEIYKESIIQAKTLVASDNTHLTNELKNEENNLDELIHMYEDSGQKVKGASDLRVNPQTEEQNNSEVKLTPTQNRGTDKNGENTIIQNSPSGSFNRTIQDIRDNVEKSVQEITATPSPLPFHEEQH
jgi:hypothetical protein